MCDYDHAALQEAGACIPAAAGKLALEAVLLICLIWTSSAAQRVECDGLARGERNVFMASERLRLKGRSIMSAAAENRFGVDARCRGVFSAWWRVKAFPIWHVRASVRISAGGGPRGRPTRDG